MQTLVLGGSWFVGRMLVADAVRRGWVVTTFNRGMSAPDPVGVTAVHGDRERTADLARLAAMGTWDVVVDVAGSVPAVVRDSVDALRQSADRYVFVSTISAYRDWPHAPVDESSPVWDGDPDYDPGTRAWDPDAYGPLKVGGEMAVARVFDPYRRLILRPHVVLGPHEYVGRLPWWLSRMRRGGRVIAPSPDRFIQPVDVRDLVTFTLDQVERGAHGVFNVAAPRERETYGDLLRACAAAVAEEADPPAELAWVDEDWLVHRGVVQWTELPLWRNAAAPWDMDASRAEAAGLDCRSLWETAADTWAWLRAGGRPVDHERYAEHGLAPEREAWLLGEWDARRS
jgi:2'-hydroxyisoflavone reductase